MEEPALEGEEPKWTCKKMEDPEQPEPLAEGEEDMCLKLTTKEDCERGSIEPEIAPVVGGDETTAEGDEVPPPAEGDEVPPAEGDLVPPAEGDQVPPTGGEEVPPAEGDEVPPADGGEVLANPDEERTNSDGSICFGPICF